jgi:hypothetical protein
MDAAEIDAGALVQVRAAPPASGCGSKAVRVHAENGACLLRSLSRITQYYSKGLYIS